MSFREHFEHKTEKEPKWYNEGAEFLIKFQTPAGSWNGQCGTVADTAFAVLFLMRSTQRAIVPTVTYKEGVMIGPANQQTAELGRQYSKRQMPW